MAKYYIIFSVSTQFINFEDTTNKLSYTTNPKLQELLSSLWMAELYKYFTFKDSLDEGQVFRLESDTLPDKLKEQLVSILIQDEYIGDEYK